MVGSVFDFLFLGTGLVVCMAIVLFVLLHIRDVTIFPEVLYRPDVIAQIKDPGSTEMFREALGNRQFATWAMLVCLATVGTYAKILRWPDSSPLYLWSNGLAVAFMAFPMVAWRTGCMEFPLAGRITSFIMVVMGCFCSWAGGEEKAHTILLVYYSIPMYVTLSFILTKSVEWGLKMSCIVWVWIMMLEWKLIAFPEQSLYCVDCLAVEMRFINVAAAIALLSYFAYASRDLMLVESLAAKTFEETARSKDVFLADVSHEFKTPLNGITGVVHLLKDDPWLRQQHREDLAVISQCTQVLQLLVENVLAQGASWERLQVVDTVARSFFLNCINIIRSLSRETTVELDIDSNVPNVLKLAPSSLLQVLLNLGSNAIKYGNKEPVLLRVRMVRSGMLDMEVIDGGPGIDESFRESLFQAYHRRDIHKQTSGTGLGLAISRKLVRQMEGVIGYRPNSPRGSVFFVRVPVAVGVWDMLDDEFLNIQEGKQPALLSSLNNPVIDATLDTLIVEDNKINQMVLTNLLKRMAVEVSISVASDGLEAIEFVARRMAHANKAPLLILMDLSMPVLSGEDTVSILRSMAEKAGWPRAWFTIIAVSAREVDSQKLHFDGFLDKPINPGQLELVVRKIQRKYSV